MLKGKNLRGFVMVMIGYGMLMLYGVFIENLYVFIAACVGYLHITILLCGIDIAESMREMIK